LDLDEESRVTTFYTTVVDIKFVPLALNLYRSLVPYIDGKIFGILCIDNESADLLGKLNLRNVWLLRPSDFETQKLRTLKAERAINEYCWTLKSVALQTGFSLDSSFEWGAYMDSDVMVFSDPDAVFNGDDAAVLAPHRFSNAHFAAYEPTVGRYNAGYVAFRNNSVGRSALEWWYDRCVALCPAVPTDGAYADQKYLDALPDLFTGIQASGHKGLNTAPWNVNSYRLSCRQGRVFVDDDPLLVYHFQGLKIYGARLYDLYAGPMQLPKDVTASIYRPIIHSLRESYEIIRTQVPGFRGCALPLSPRRVATQLRRLIGGTSNLALA
jgi:hypothetical protein